MRYPIYLICILLLGTFMSQAQDNEDSSRPQFLAHYMPWYQTPETSGYWGWHWTMEHFNPQNVDENGRQEIASHYTPLTGAYDSQDGDLLEYQVLLMHLSGIDGVIVDWYGIEDFRDYKVNHDASLALFEYTRRANLDFALAYEDATVGFMVDGGHIDADATTEHAQETMQYVDEQWFSDESYVHFNEQPLLFVFGPQYYRDPAIWEAMFADLDSNPALVTLEGHLDWAALASYPWPPMHLAGGGELYPAVLDSHLERFYRNAQRGEPALIVGSAFPQFHDIYSEAGVRSSYGYLDAQDGETFRHTMQWALDSQADIIQLVTWNDYGEGTIIEPTEETGYQYLEMMQETRRSLDADFSYTADDLRLPLQLFNLRKAHADDADIKAQLDAIFEAIIHDDLETARDILANYQAG